MKPINKHRVITQLDRKEIDYLDKLSKDALFSTGHKLSHSEILEGLVDLAMEMDLSGERMGSLDEFKQEILRQIAAKLVAQKVPPVKKGENDE